MMRLLCLCLMIMMLTVGCGGSSSDEAAGGGGGGDNVTDNATDNQTVVQKGSRVLGIDLLDVADGESFNDNVVRARDIGIDFIALHRNWDQLQDDNGTIDIETDAVKALYDVAVGNGWKMSLTIRPIDLIGKSVPSYLENESFADFAIQDNFTRLLDELFTHIDPDNLTALFIGNEIDGYNYAADAHSGTFWSDYGIFLDNMTRHIHDTISASLKIGFTATHGGLTDDAPGSPNALGVFDAFAGVVDVIGFTYYPIDGAFSVYEPWVVADDLAAIVTAYPDTELMMQEIGYPTGDNNTSSDAKQETFFRDAFAAWDDLIDNVTSANIVRLVDHSHENAISAAEPYGLDGNAAFVSYLETLGLVRHDGTAKPAYTAVVEEAESRGW